MDPRIQYAHTSDGVSIAFWAIGEGPPLVIMPALPVSHIEIEWQIPEWRAWYERLAERRTVVRYDGRGTGLSERHVVDYSLNALQLDLQAVVDRLGLDKFALMAIYQGGPAAIAYAASHPDAVLHLVLWCTFARGIDVHSPQIEATRILIEQDWELYTQTVAHVLLGWEQGEPARRFASFIRQSIEPEAVISLIKSSMEVDVTPLLASVSAPTLVMHRRQIQFLDLQLSRTLAAGIPNARLAIVDGSSIAVYLEGMESVLETVYDFLGEGAVSRHPAAATLKTLLFTDIEGHTAMMQRLGDDKGRAVLRDLERITRDALRAHGGSEVKTMGDGFMASFGSAQGALECAVAMQRAFAERSATVDTPLKVRIGLNAGEPIAEEHDLFGTAVILASRAAAQAQGGQILATDVVRQLASGKGFSFVDRGESPLRGFEDPVRLYEVKW